MKAGNIIERGTHEELLAGAAFTPTCMQASLPKRNACPAA